MRNVKLKNHNYFKKIWILDIYDIEFFDNFKIYIKKIKNVIKEIKHC